MIRFTSTGSPRKLEATIVAHRREVVAHAVAGRKPPKDIGTTDLPDELIDALDADLELAEAFGALTPGR